MQEAKIFVIYHRTKEYYRDLLSYPDEASGNRANLILNKIAEWDEFFKVPFEEVKRRIVRIAFMGVENWECDGIINWRDGATILENLKINNDEAFYFQLDDDDWINPALFPTLKEKLQEKKYNAICWDAIYHNSDFSQWWKDNPIGDYRKPLKDPSVLNPLVFHRRCKEVVEEKNMDAQRPGIFFGGTYGFRLRPEQTIYTGLHDHRQFEDLRKKERNETLLKLSDQPYYFRLFNPTGRGWFKHTGGIKDAHQLAINELIFFRDFDSSDFFFHEQAKAYAALLEEIIK